VNAPGLIVLAGGFGTRVSHLLPGVPKPMASVAGRPFVEWVIRYFVRWGCSEAVLATGHLAEIVESHFACQPVPGVRVTCRREEGPLGTAGGCVNALPLGADPDRIWWVVNGDSMVFADPRPLLAPLVNGDADASLLGLELDDASRFGSLDVDAQGRLWGFREKRLGAGVINAGVYAFTAACLCAAPTFRPLSFEYDVFPTLAKRGRVMVTRVNAPFLDIGTPSTLAEAEQFISTHLDHFP